MPFPLGISLANRSPAGTVTWAWAINGIFTVAGGLAAAVLSLLVGYRLTIAIGLLTYMAAAVLFAAARRKDSAGR
jgi:fucose permease